MAAPPSVATHYPLTPLQKAFVLLLPWLFLGVLVWVSTTFLYSRFAEWHLLQYCLGIFVFLVFLSFLTAAITFSRDVLRGRYP